MSMDVIRHRSRWQGPFSLQLLTAGVLDRWVEIGASMPEWCRWPQNVRKSYLVHLVERSHYGISAGESVIV